MQPRAWRGLVVGGVAAVIGFFAFAHGADRGYVFDVLGVATAAGIFIGVRLNRPNDALPWHLVAAGTFVAVVGRVTQADLVHLCAYPFFGAGLVMLIRQRTDGRDRAGLIDAAIVSISTGAAAWVLLIQPHYHDPNLSGLAKIVAIALPLVDVLFVALTARLLAAPGRRTPADRTIAVAVLCAVAADSVYATLTTGGRLVDIGWMLALLGWCVASLHPSMSELSQLAPAEPGVSRTRLWLLSGSSLAIPGLAAVQVLSHGHLPLTVFIGGPVAIFLLAVSRVSGLVNDLSSTLEDNHRVVQRERVLRAAGVSLVSATDGSAIEKVAVESAMALGGAGSSAFIAERPPLAERDIYSAPLRVGEKVRGHLVVRSRTDRPDELLDALDALASHVALALEATELAADLVNRNTEDRLAAMVRHSSDVIAVLGADGFAQYVSPSVLAVLGWTAEELHGQVFFEHVHPDDHDLVVGAFAEALALPGTRAPVEYRYRHRHGAWRHLEAVCTNLLDDPAVAGVVLNARDVTERKELEDQLTHQAFHDPLTHLANRALFSERVSHALRMRRAESGAVAVLFCDLDDFKTVNDSLGHAVGDAVLKAVADRLIGCLRPGDTAARLGGDEFAILLEDGADTELATVVATRLVEALAAPLTLEMRDVQTAVSVGIAIGRPGLDDADALLRNADVAMYAAKAKGKNGWELFQPAMHEAVLERLEMGRALRLALDAGEFELHYQPIVHLSTGEVAGVEALVRWNHPERGIVLPDEFIPLAEETGFVVALGRWVLTRAALQGKAWQAANPELFMSVNLSARQLQEPGLVTEIAGILATTGMSPTTLVLEITETVLMRDAELANSALATLRKLGIRLALDDFGTGYSSLSYLQQFPVDILKIDKSFIDGTGDSGHSLAAAIVELGRSLGLKMVAEGVEQPEQAEWLVRLGCDRAQGYYFGRPVTAGEVTALLEAHTPAPRVAVHR